MPNQKVAGQPCEFCGAELVENPKTGKVFCSQKCWLKNSQSQTPKVYPTKAQVFGQQLDQEKRDGRIEKMFNEKQDNIALMNSKNNATLVMAQRQPANLDDLIAEWKKLVFEFLNYNPEDK